MIGKKFVEPVLDAANIILTRNVNLNIGSEFKSHFNSRDILKILPINYYITNDNRNYVTFNML